MLRDSLEQLTPGLGLDGELAHGEGPQPVQLLLGLQLLLVRGQRLPDGTSLLGPQVLGNVLLVLVELAHVGLGRLVDDDVDAGDVLADDADLGELAGGAAGDLGHAERGQLGLQLIQLLGELLLFLAAELVTLHDGRLPAGREKHTRSDSVVYSIHAGRYSFTIHQMHSSSFTQLTEQCIPPQT